MYDLFDIQHFVKRSLEIKIMSVAVSLTYSKVVRPDANSKSFGKGSIYRKSRSRYKDVLTLPSQGCYAKVEGAGTAAAQHNVLKTSKAIIFALFYIKLVKINVDMRVISSNYSLVFKYLFMEKQ